MNLEIKKYIEPKSGLPVVKWKQRKAYKREGTFASWYKGRVPEFDAVPFYGWEFEIETIEVTLVAYGEHKLARSLTPREREILNTTDHYIFYPYQKIGGFKLTQQDLPARELGRMQWQPLEDLIELDLGNGRLSYLAAHIGKGHPFQELRAVLHEEFIEKRPHGGWKSAPLGLLSEWLNYRPTTNQEAIDLAEDYFQWAMSRVGEYDAHDYPGPKNWGQKKNKSGIAQPFSDEDDPI